MLGKKYKGRAFPQRGGNFSYAKWGHAKLPWINWSSHKLFLNRVEVLARGRDSESERKKRLSVCTDLVGLWQRSWQPVRPAGEVWAQLPEPLGKHRGRAWPRCQAEIVSVHTTYVSRPDLAVTGSALVAGWGALRTSFHSLSATVDQTTNGLVTLLDWPSIVS